MKNQRNILLTISLASVLVIIISWGCQKSINSKIQNNKYVSQKQKERTRASGGFMCSCWPYSISPGCLGACAQRLLGLPGTTTSKSWTIHWNTCDNAPWPGFSTATFCYTASGVCDSVNLNINLPPSCMPCFTTDDFCMQLYVNCTMQDVVSGSFFDPSTGTTYEAWIGGDPTIHLKCTDAHGVYHQVDGSY